MINENKINFLIDQKQQELIILPLYSFKTGDVEERSGLNLWNAKGRLRQANEVYIPIPTWIHRRFPAFFPSKKIVFNLHLPNKRSIKAKMCQNMLIWINGIKTDKGKGLMSNPNTDLGHWILRDILKVAEGKLITYKMLEDIGIDSVEVRKLDKLNYEIDFKKLGSFQKFYENNKI